MSHSQGGKSHWQSVEGVPDCQEHGHLPPKINQERSGAMTAVRAKTKTGVSHPEPYPEPSQVVGRRGPGRPRKEELAIRGTIGAKPVIQRIDPWEEVRPVSTEAKHPQRNLQERELPRRGLAAPPEAEDEMIQTRETIPEKNAGGGNVCEEPEIAMRGMPEDIPMDEHEECDIQEEQPDRVNKATVERMPQTRQELIDLIRMVREPQVTLPIEQATRIPEVRVLGTSGVRSPRNYK